MGDSVSILRSRARRFGWSLGLSLSAGVILASLAAATTVQTFDLDGLVAASSDIVVGRVENVESRWDRAHANIVTAVTVAVEQRLKGASASRITVYQLGGEVGHVRVEVDGCPAFRRGEEGVYFLARDRAGHALLTGLEQGRFTIEHDREGAAVVRRLPQGIARVPQIAIEGQIRGAYALDAFLDEVRNAVRAGAK